MSRSGPRGGTSPPPRIRTGPTAATWPRYTAASAAYAELRTPWGRSEAYADLAEQAGDGPATSPIPVIPGEEPPPVPPSAAAAGPGPGPARIRSGRPLRLAIRGLIATGLALIVLQLIPGAPAAPADILGLIIWFVLTGRKDLAPPPER